MKKPKVGYVYTRGLATATDSLSPVDTILEYATTSESPSIQG